jgi:hypothetical protein
LPSGGRTCAGIKQKTGGRSFPQKTFENFSGLPRNRRDYLYIFTPSDLVTGLNSPQIKVLTAKSSSRALREGAYNFAG